MGLVGALGLEAVGAAGCEAVLLDRGEELDCGVGEVGLATVDETQLALHLQFFDQHADERAAAQFSFDGERGHESDAVAELDEAPDGLKRGQFDADAQGCFVAAKGLKHLCALGRGHVVRDKVFVAEVADGYVSGSSQGVARVDDEGEIIAKDDDGFERAIVWLEAENAYLDGVREHLVCDAAGERALHADHDARVGAAKTVKHRQQVEAGVLVGGQQQSAAVQRAQFAERLRRFNAQVQQLHGVFAQDHTGIGERAVAGSTLKESFAQFCLKLGDGLADGGLGAMEALGRA